MNNENEIDGPPQEVIDEEGDVDKAIKRRIIQARERVDETELALYRDATIEPNVNLDEFQKIHIYATTVKQFLRRIEPLLRTKDVPSNKEYYTEIEIGQIELTPPDTQGYRFSIIGQTNRPDKQVRRMLDLPRGVDLPKPIPIPFVGLKSVIEREPVVQNQWEVCVKRVAARPNWEYVYPRAQQPVPKRIYENAVRKADMFLQQAGIGLDTDTAGTEIISEFDMSGEEPQAEYTVGDYSSNPDI